MRRRRSLHPKPKPVHYELLARDEVVAFPIYQMLDEIVKQHHEELTKANIALAFCTNWRPDADGRVKLGQCRRSTDLDRQLHVYDFVILLRKSWWQWPTTSDEQRRAVLDHELCHARRKYDANGEPLEDEHGRPVWRVAGHDLEEFAAIVKRHGLYKADIEKFFAAHLRETPAKFEGCEACKDTDGWIPSVVNGISRVTRCPCWIRWSERKQEQREQEAVTA